MKAIVTGATGLLGCALVKTLLSEGCEVYALIRPQSLHRSRLPQHNALSVCEADLSDLSSVKCALPDDVDMFFHLAWAGTAALQRDDVKLQTANIFWTLDAVELAKAVRSQVFVGVGSQAEFGRVEGLVSPDTPCNPETAYGIAKLCAGQMSRSLCANYGIRHEWARVLSLYGPHDASDTMISSLIVSLLLDGGSIELTPCEQIWDYLYADDAGKALSLIAQKGSDGSVYCVGSGKGAPLRDYVRVIRDVTSPGAPLNIGAKDYAPNQVMHLCADLTNLRKDTGFSPSIPFEEGALRTVEWMRARMEGDVHENNISTHTML